MYSSSPQPPWPTTDWVLRELKFYAAGAAVCGLGFLVASAIAIGTGWAPLLAGSLAALALLRFGAQAAMSAFGSSTKLLFRRAKDDTHDQAVIEPETAEHERATHSEGLGKRLKENDRLYNQSSRLSQEVAPDRQPPQPDANSQRLAARKLEREPTERRVLLIGRGISLRGFAQDVERLVVEGTMEAIMLYASELSIAPGGVFKGEADVDDAEVAGIIDGTLTAYGSLTVRSTGRVIGTARCRRLQVEDGGQIIGCIEMLTEATASLSARVLAAPIVFNQTAQKS